MTLSREHHTKRIIPSSPKSFRTIIEETRQRICDELDATAQEEIEGNHNRADVRREFKGV